MQKIPPQGTKAREMFALEDLVAIAERRADPVLCIQGGRYAARRFFASADRAAARVVYIVLRADDKLQLVSFGRRGGWKVEWNFGPGLKGNG